MSEQNKADREQFRLYSWPELQDLPSLEWQVDKVCPVGSLVVIYGGSGEGKSFLALDLALSVAEGRPWLGRRVEHGSVVYVAAEGGRGIRNRVAAWIQHNGVDVLSNSFFLLEAVQARDREELESLVALMQARNIKPALIVVDTLARCFDGNENSSEDMGDFIRGLAWLQQVTGATVMVLHHTGKHSDKERGSSALRGAADVMMHVSMTDDCAITVRNDKMKDDEEFPSIKLKLEQVAIHDSDDTSCVLLSREQTTRQDRNAVPSHLRKTLVALKQRPDGTATRGELLAVIDSRARTLDTHLRELEQLQYIEHPQRGLYRVTPEGAAACQSEHQRLMGTAATARNLHVVQGGK